MSIERFFTTPVTIVTPGSQATRYGDLAADWDNPISEVETVGWLTQTSTTEQLGSRDQVVTQWKLYLAASEQIAVADRVIADGSIYAVEGDPHHAQRPAGAHHIEVSLLFVSEVEAGVGS